MMRDDVDREAGFDENPNEVNDGGAADSGAPHAQTGHAAGNLVDSEADILRSELAALSEKLSAAKTESSAATERYMRSRAEFDTYRRRMVDELSMAREKGFDSAVLPVLTVADDLGRALQAAEAATEAASIVAGIRAVHDNLLRSLEVMGVSQVGHVGERFDPQFHEAVAALPPTNPQQAGTIRDVHRAGFAKGERVIRPATVTVYQE